MILYIRYLKQNQKKIKSYFDKYLVNDFIRFFKSSIDAFILIVQKKR